MPHTTLSGGFLALCRVVVKKSWPAPRDLSHRIPGDDRANDGQGEQVNSSSSSTRFPELRSDPDAGFWLSVQSTIPDGVRSLLIYLVCPYSFSSNSSPGFLCRCCWVE